MHCVAKSVPPGPARGPAIQTVVSVTIEYDCPAEGVSLAIILFRAKETVHQQLLPYETERYSKNL